MSDAPTFGLGMFERRGERYPGLVVDDTVFDLRGAFGEQATTLSLLGDWDATLERLTALAEQVEPADGIPFTDVRPLPPVLPSGQLWCAGANYYSHNVEMTEMLLRNDPDRQMSEEEIKAEAIAVADRVVTNGQPFLFGGMSSALAGAHDDIVLWGPGYQHDWELEIAVVIGRRAHRIGAAAAMDHVAGYTICNDVSSRDVMLRPGFALTDFLMSKSRPTFFPIGPYLVPRQFVPDYRDLRIEFLLNGKVMQSGTGGDMIFGVEELISYASHLGVLEPGDVLLTGTPSGNAAAYGGRWLRAGDVTQGRITGLGSLRNHCVPEPDGARS
ncbi:fumarylacetoacetate hydrolase family protein [Actinomadura rayongensis]|uniref:Hydrolase n=1 Tax=Actinomadura rayongensis TaxID=1429076 RepID=A0A6I4WLP7_9ACTN|nr:fumarylacetoacetate hydrolase family protein [Actinomadura rayongensis]MXQ67552.1 hydrolase [Actinomadura rayongensis]